MKLKDWEKRAEDGCWGGGGGGGVSCGVDSAANCESSGGVCISCGVDSAAHCGSNGNSSTGQKYASQKGHPPLRLTSIRDQNVNSNLQCQEHVLQKHPSIELSDLERINAENQIDSVNAEVTSTRSTSTDNNAVIHNFSYTKDSGFSIQETTSPELTDSALIDRKMITKASTNKSKSVLKKKIKFTSPSLEKLAFLVITLVLTIGGIVLNALNIRKLVDFAITFHGTLTVAPTFKVMFKGSLTIGRLTAYARFSLEDLFNPTRFEAKADIIINKTAKVLPETCNMASTTFSCEEDDFLQFSVRNIIEMLPAQGIWASKFCTGQESHYKTDGKQLKRQDVVLNPVWGEKCCEWAHESLEYVYHNIQDVCEMALTSMAKVPIKRLGIVTSRKGTTSIPIIWRKATFGLTTRKILVAIVIRYFAIMGTIIHSIALAATSSTIKIANPSPKFRLDLGGIKSGQSSASHSRRGDRPNHGGPADSGEGTNYSGTSGYSDSGTSGYSDSGTGGCSSDGAGYSGQRSDPRDTNNAGEKSHAGDESNGGIRDNLEGNPDGTSAPEGTSNFMDRPGHLGRNCSPDIQRVFHPEDTDIPSNTDPSGCSNPSAVLYPNDIFDPGGTTDGAVNPEGSIRPSDEGLDSNRTDYSHRTTGYSCAPDLKSMAECNMTSASLQYKPEQRLIEACSQKLEQEKVVTKEFTLPYYVGLPNPVSSSTVYCVSSPQDYSHSKREAIKSVEPHTLFTPKQAQLYMITIPNEPHFEVNKSLPDQSRVAIHDYTPRSNSVDYLRESSLFNPADSDTSESSAYTPVGDQRIEHAKAAVDNFEFLAVPSFTGSSARIYWNNDTDDLILTAESQQYSSLFMIPAVEATSAGQYTTSVQNALLPTIENNALLVPNSLEPYATPTSTEAPEDDSEMYMEQTGGSLDCTDQRNCYDLLWKTNALCVEYPVKDNLETMSSLGDKNKP